MRNSLTQYLAGDNLPVIEGDALAKALAAATEDATTGGGDGPDYLSFSGKSGLYSLGRDKVEIDPDQLYLVETQSFSSGWICWLKSKPVDRLEWSVFKPPSPLPTEDDLEDHGPYRQASGDGWQQQLGFGAIGCDKVLSQLQFSTSSKSGRNSVGDLSKEIGTRSSAGEPHMPVIFFDSVEFEAQGNTNYKPVFTVEAWVGRPSAAAYLNGDMTVEQLVAGDAPKKLRSRAGGKKRGRGKK